MPLARRVILLWGICLCNVLTGQESTTNEVVDDPETYWDERLMPLLAPIIKASQTWEPPKSIDWNPTRLEADQALVGGSYQLDLDTRRLEVLFDQLNLDYPGLEQVRELYEVGDLNATALALVEHYRSKEWADVMLINNGPPSHLDYVLVEAALIDVFTQGHVFGRQPRDKNGLYDWEHQGPRNDPEWAWWLNRMGYLPRAVSLWEVTGDPRYVEIVDDHIANWVLANEYPESRSFSAPWRPLEVARRIDKSWIDTLIRLRHAKGFSPETRLLMISSMPDHADALLNYPSFHGNHLLTEKVMLAQLAVAFPEFKGAPRWLEDSTNSVMGLMGKQVYPDGSYEELTNHYHLVALGSLQRFLELLEIGEARDLIARIKPAIESMWNYFAYVMRPSGFGPLNNDSDLEDNRTELARALRWFDHPDWEFLVSSGSSGTEPEGIPSRYFPWAGHAIMRDGWDANAQWAFFDIGPYGSDHQHRDKLHLSVSLGGKDFLVDSGRYDYTPGTTRDYFKGPTGHNVLLLDDQQPLTGPKKVSAPMHTLAEITPDLDRFGATVSFPANAGEGNGPREHTRVVHYRRGIGWVVFDEVITFEPTDVSIRWLFHPDRIVETEGTELVTADPEGANLRVAPLGQHRWELNTYRGQGEPFEAGWYSPEFTIRFPATQAIYETTITGPTVFVWLIAPTNADWNDLRHTEWLDGIKLPLAEDF